MTQSRMFAGLAAALLAAGVSAGAIAAVRSQEGAPPGPGPEHAYLAKYAGNWKATVTTRNGPDLPPEVTEGKSTARLACGGMWLVTDLEATMFGGPFSGHEVLGFDPQKKKYISTWVDSMGSGFTTGESEHDAKKGVMSGLQTGMGSDGNPTTWRAVDTWKDADTHEWQMIQKGDDGKEFTMIAIVYRRVK